jgi:hypothetical protein
MAGTLGSAGAEDGLSRTAPGPSGFWTIEATMKLVAVPLTCLVALSVVPSMALPSGHDGHGPDTIEFIRDAHRASRDLIRTAECQVKLEVKSEGQNGSAPVRQWCTAHYWLTADALRVQVQGDPEGRLDYVVRDRLRTALSTKESGGRTQVAASKTKHSSRFVHRCDAWACGLLALNVPDTTEYVPFEQLADRASRVVGVKRTVQHGQELVVVTLAFGAQRPGGSSSTAEVSFDPTVNYLVRGMRITQPGTYTLVREYRVEEFAEPRPGIYFPKRSSGRVESAGTLFGTHEAAITLLRLNDPISEDHFRLQFPDGIVMTDSVQGTRYRIDAYGNPISDARPLFRGPAPPQVPDEPPAAAAPPGTETQAEPVQT